MAESAAEPLQRFTRSLTKNRGWSFLEVVNTQLKQGVNESVSRLSTSVAIGAGNDEGRDVE